MSTDAASRRDPIPRTPRGIGILAHGLLVVGLVGEAALLAIVGPEDPELVTWRLPFALLSVVTVVSGWIIAGKRPRNPLGWIILAVGVFPALQAATSALAEAAPGTAGWTLLPRPDNPWTWIPTTGVLLTLVPLLFPDGSLPSPRWRPVFPSVIAALTLSTALVVTLDPALHHDARNPVFVDWGASLPLVAGVAIALVGGPVLVSLASLVIRYRRADAVARAQLRWIYLALAVISGLLVIVGLDIAVFGDETTPGVAGLASHLAQLAVDLSFSLIPLAILFAVLRRGLYSIDRIVSRTAAYAIVTIAIIAVYAAISLLGSLLLPNLASVGVAVATLASAAVFLPLLRTVRRAVDRRFDRARYDAAREVDAFGERVRTGVDPHDAGPALVAAVERTLHPSGVGLWTRERAA